jgi:hypothetical protein
VCVCGSKDEDWGVGVDEKGEGECCRECLCKKVRSGGLILEGHLTLK